MGRALAFFSGLSLLVLTSAAGAQPGKAPPPGGGAPPPAGAPAAGAPGAGGPAGTADPGAPQADPATPKKPVVAATGYGYGGGKPKKDAQPAPVRQVARHVAGPVATLPGFEMLPDGGSRLFVDLSQSVPVEERKAQGSVTYVLKGAHLEHRNNANALVTVHFNTPVWRAKLVPSGGDLLFVVEMRSQAAQGAMKMTPGAGGATRLTVDFAKGEYLGGGVSDEATQKMMTGKGGAQ